ncbi:hypothetical protein J6590_038852 [Homalodisca vitripennis]|nr:hypothetical protein J6590_038852 [Homalodisca vitripennis]
MMGSEISVPLDYSDSLIEDHEWIITSLCQFWISSTQYGRHLVPERRRSKWTSNQSSDKASCCPDNHSPVRASNIIWSKIWQHWRLQISRSSIEHTNVGI